MKRWTDRNFLLISLLLIGCYFSGFSQTTKIDRLKNIFWNELIPEKQGELALQICKRYFSLPQDTLLKYIRIGEKLVHPNSLMYFELKNIYTQCIFRSEEMHLAISYTDSLLDAVSNLKDAEHLRLEIKANHARALIRDNRVEEALGFVYTMLQESEMISDTSSLITSYSLLGWAYMEIEKYRDAIYWMNKGFQIPDKDKYPLQIGILCANNASCYNNISRLDTGFYFINLALGYFQKEENLTGMANSLNIRASLYLKVEEFDSAQADLERALQAREQIGDMHYIISDMAQLSSFYSFLGQSEKGIPLAQKGIAIAEETNNLSKLIFLYQALANNYKAGGQFEKRSEALEKLLSLKDSLVEKNSVKEIADMAARYDLQKKENIIIQQQFALQRNRVIAIGSVVLFVLGTILAWLLYRNYRLVQQKKYTSLLAEQMVRSEKEIHSAKENERKRISADLHDNLGAHAAAITSNVKYLKEESDGKYENLISQLDENAQNIVTQLNETIWVLKHESLPITTLADRYKLWMQRLMKNYPDVKYHYSESIKEDLEFSPTKILHIFFILKECVTNALKHSLCTELTINIISDKGWKIIIQDNGIGIDLDKVPPYRGVHNIGSRAKDCGCSVIWGNLKPSGTSVTISGATTN